MEKEIILNPDRHLKKYLKDNGYETETNKVLKPVEVVAKPLPKQKVKKTKEEKLEARKKRTPEEQAKIDERIKKMNDNKHKKKQSLFD